MFLYISKGPNRQEITTTILPILQDKAKPTIVMGDMNYHYLEEKHPLKDLFAENGYVQIVDKATHDEGNIIDHVYVSSPDLLLKEKLFLKPLYYSDHDALCFRLPRNKIVNM